VQTGREPEMSLEQRAGFPEHIENSLSVHYAPFPVHILVSEQRRQPEQSSTVYKQGVWMPRIPTAVQRCVVYILETTASDRPS
jgi:hypothetical protein